MIVYSALLTLGLVACAPWWLWRMLTSGRYREGLAQRLGHIPAAVKAQVAGREVIWVHAVSVGEVLAVERLVRELQAARPAWAIALSTTTSTAQNIARERFPGLPVFFFPLDLAFAVRSWMRVLRPRLLVLVEGELWPRMLYECEQARMPVVIVNARVSDRSFRRMVRVKSLWLHMASRVQLFLAQGEETAQRLLELGIAADRIQIGGNLKYDADVAAPSEIVETLRSALQQDTQLVVCGSTLEGEEAMLLDVWPQVLKLRPKAQLLLAPRHPDRFDAVAKLLSDLGFNVIRATEWTQAPSAIDRDCVFLLDTLGSLAAIYGLAAVAFVGGSLIPKGGHNPLEPARFGVPVLMGESYENFREMVREMLAARAIGVVPRDRLAHALTALLFDGKPMGERGRLFFETQAGATTRTLAALLELIP